MAEVLKWVTAVLAIWGAVSILGAVFWALIGRKIFRPRPVPSEIRRVGDADVLFIGGDLKDRRGEQ
jgi:hypothetical protein